jgi:hypothetical protein
MTQKTFDAFCQAESRKCGEFFSPKNEKESLSQGRFSCYSFPASKATMNTSHFHRAKEIVKIDISEMSKKDINTLMQEVIGILKFSRLTYLHQQSNCEVRMIFSLEEFRKNCLSTLKNSNQ